MMKHTNRLFIAMLFVGLLVGCKLHDDIDVSVKRKAVVYLRYNYNDGEHDTMDEVQTVRLFFFDLKTGRQYRDTTLTREKFLTDTGAMQTYISNGEYGIVTLANVGHGSTVSADNLGDAAITFPEMGADPVFFNRIETPILKGDSLRFDIDLFKSVYKVNVLIEGMQNIDNPEDFYFGLNNYAALSFDNKPCGDFRMYRPRLTVDPVAGTMSGTFFTPYFPSNLPISLGIYTNNPASIYGHELFAATIQRYMEIVPNPGHDVEIDIRILLNGANVTVIISDWEGTVIQEDHFGI
jgi:lipoprotein